MNFRVNYLETLNEISFTLSMVEEESVIKLIAIALQLPTFPLSNAKLVSPSVLSIVNNEDSSNIYLLH